MCPLWTEIRSKWDVWHDSRFTCLLNVTYCTRWHDFSICDLRESEQIKKKIELKEFFSTDIIFASHFLTVFSALFFTSAPFAWMQNKTKHALNDTKRIFIFATLLTTAVECGGCSVLILLQQLNKFKNQNNMVSRIQFMHKYTWCCCCGAICSNFLDFTSTDSYRNFVPVMSRTR